jgi:hypothetical protein
MVVAPPVAALPVLAADARQRGLAGPGAGAGEAAGEMDVPGELAPAEHYAAPAAADMIKVK